MLRPTKKLALALEAVVDIAFYGVAEPVQSQDVATRLQLPRRYLEQVMQQLVRAGILKGVRGPRGGYRLARERRRIAVADIVKVVEGVDESDDNQAVYKSAMGRSVMEPFWGELEDIFLKELEGRTIEDLCGAAENVGMASSSGSDADFSI